MLFSLSPHSKSSGYYAYMNILLISILLLLCISPSYESSDNNQSVGSDSPFSCKIKLTILFSVSPVAPTSILDSKPFSQR